MCVCICVDFCVVLVDHPMYCIRCLLEEVQGRGKGNVGGGGVAPFTHKSHSLQSFHFTPLMSLTGGFSREQVLVHQLVSSIPLYRDQTLQ